MRNSQKNRQVEVQGQVYEVESEELRQWVVEGSVLPTDNVRRRDLRWLPAEKVPALRGLFSAEPVAGVSRGDAATGAETATIIQKGLPDLSGSHHETDSAVNFAADKIAVKSSEESCYRHTGAQTDYACDICENFFCKRCPKSFGGSVRLCPLCGSLCRKLNEAANGENAVGSIRKPYVQPGKSFFEEKISNDSPNPGFWKSLGYSLKNYKNKVL